MPGTTCAIIAHEQKSLLKIFDIIRRAYVNLPDIIKPTTNADNVNEYKFMYNYLSMPLDSAIYVSLKIRSGTVQRLHITESAYIKDRQELNSGSKQAVPITGWITEETTGNGMNAYYDDYMVAYNNKNPGEMDYKAYFYPWSINPEYSLTGVLEEPTQTEINLRNEYHLTDGQLLFRRWKIKQLANRQIGLGLSGEQLFKQEYPLTVYEAFQSGAGGVFDSEKIEQLKPVPAYTEADIHKLSTEKNYTPDYKTKVMAFVTTGAQLWKLPEQGKEYVVGVDPSDGQGSDFGVIDVWQKADETGHLEQVAQYYGKLLPDDLAILTKDLADFYNHAYTGVENNMLSTILFLSKIYDNYYYTTKIDEKIQKKTKKLGWNTNVQTREKMIDDFIIHFRDDLLIIRSAITVSEMHTFIRKALPSGTFKREHADGKWDDALFAGMIAVQMSLNRVHHARAFGTNPL